MESGVIHCPPAPGTGVGHTEIATRAKLMPLKPLATKTAPWPPALWPVLSLASSGVVFLSQFHGIRRDLSIRRHWPKQYHVKGLKKQENNSSSNTSYLWHPAVPNSWMLFSARELDSMLIRWRSDTHRQAGWVTVNSLGKIHIIGVLLSHRLPVVSFQLLCQSWVPPSKT